MRRTKRKRLPTDQRIDLWVRGTTWEALRERAHQESASLAEVVERSIRSALGLPPLPPPEEEVEEGSKGGYVLAGSSRTAAAMGLSDRPA